ncbi:MAG: hypothetical protein HYY61_00155 [Deltaproteobacteria bacterium]|nr:hypothetical protein [Deltaproteobacteria bacterium]
MFKKIFVVLSLFVSFSFFAQEDPQVFVVVGYGAKYEVQNPEFLDSEDSQKRQEAQEKVIESVLEKLRDIDGVLIDWEVQNQFYASSPLSDRKVVPHFVFISDREAHFTIRPMIWVGQKSRLPQALQSLNGKEVSGGKFKVEEIKDASYGLKVIFGFYNKDKKELEPLWTPKISMNAVSTLDLAFEGQKSSFKELLASYQKRPEYKLNVRQLVQLMCVYFTLVDASWLEEGFIPEEQRIPQPSALPEGKNLIVLGVLQEAGELYQFLRR